MEHPGNIRFIEEYLEQGTLAGSPARIRRRFEEEFVNRPGVTGLIVGADQVEGLELLADLAGTRDQVA